MAHVLERVPVGRITEQAKQVKFHLTLLAVVAGVLYGIGWLVAKAFTVVWFVIAWCGVAVKIGWVDARKGGRNGAS